MKKYIADSTISLSVTLPNGNPTRVSFSPMSGNRSVFYTSDKDVQWGLEHHYKFGTLFRLDQENIKVEIKPAPKKRGRGKKNSQKESDSNENNIIEVPSPAPDDIENNEDMSDYADDEVSDDTFKEVTVTDPADAKDYLAEKFEIVRTKLKTEDDINKAAAGHGVVFKYL